nr:hypothetical protein Itr_chr09CG10170 [Ipomoea trifida]
MSRSPRSEKTVEERGLDSWPWARREMRSWGRPKVDGQAWIGPCLNEVTWR